MTTETIKFRSAKQAQAEADKRGLTEGQYTITKVATAKYELVITIANEPTEDKPAKAPRPTRVNVHHNDDGSMTIYVRGVKVRKFGGENNEEASEEELEDTEGFVEKYLNRKFPKKAGGWVWGRTTSGHNWHTKRQKALRARIAELEALPDTGENLQALVEARAELARIGGK